MQRIHALEDRIAEEIRKAGAGEFDGDEFGEGICTLYMYGPSTARLYTAAIQPLAQYGAPNGSYLVKRFGKPGAKEERIDLANAPGK